MDYKETYERCFALPGYSRHDSSEPRYVFLRYCLSVTGAASLLDIGSGRGTYLSDVQQQFPLLKVVSADVSRFSSAPVEFIPYDISTDSIPTGFDMISCLDVLEHIEEKYLSLFLREASSVSDMLCVTVANHSDIQCGMELHVTQKPKKWWSELFSECYNIVTDDISSISVSGIPYNKPFLDVALRDKLLYGYLLSSKPHV